MTVITVIIMNKISSIYTKLCFRVFAYREREYRRLLIKDYRRDN